MTICSLESYSIKKGKTPPKDCFTDIYIDARSLKGPEKSLHHKQTGENRDVHRDIMERQENVEALTTLKDTVKSFADDKDVTYDLHIGCDLGIHRSVVFTNSMAAEHGVINVLHRDLKPERRQKKFSGEFRDRNRRVKQNYMNLIQ